MDEASSLGVLCRPRPCDQDATQIVPLRSTDPMLGEPDG
jgi:hypothetical protein